MNERKVLGKGLSSLIPSIGGSKTEANKEYFLCPMNDIVPNQNQPRKLFDRSAIDELAASIEEKGILQPLLVRSLGGGKYEIIVGERRYRAAQQLHLPKVPVIVKDVEQQEVLELALIENIQRQDLNPIEEALAYKELLGQYQYTQDELAKRVGKDRSSIANTLRLLRLPDDIRGYIISRQISMGHARAILGVESRELQETIAQEIIKNGLSVRDIENWMSRLKEGKIESENKTREEKVEKLKEVDLRFKNLEHDLKARLKTKVQIKAKGNQGKLVILFHSIDELNRLVEKF